jgi:hypothetical protein
VFFYRFRKRLINFSSFKKYGSVCYVVGSGPSLKLKDLENIKDDFSISSNRIYHLFPETSWRPKIYVVQDEACLKVQLKDIEFTRLLDTNLWFVFPQFAFAISKIRQSTAQFYKFIDSDGGCNFRLASDGHFFPMEVRLL